MTNQDLTLLMDTSDEWIVERTGIRERRWVPEGMSGAEMAKRAGLMALEGAGLSPAVLTSTEGEDRGVPSTHLHSDGRYAEMLWVEFESGKHHPRITAEMIHEARHYPSMDGREVFKHAIARMPEAVREALAANGLGIADLDLLIPHQANLRITQMVQRRLGLSDAQVVSNIHKYGNTTAATIPIALAEAVREGRLARGDLLCLVAFGSGFTWGSALVRW